MGFFSALGIGLTIAAMAQKAKAEHDAGQAAQRAGAAEGEAAEGQAQLADYNAKVADLQARDALERGAEFEARYRTQVQGMIGTQRAGQAQGNLDVGFGSPLDVQADAAFLGELDAHTIRTNAAREAWGYEVQAYNLRTSAYYTRKTGKNLVLAGQERAKAANYAAAGTLLGGTSSLLLSKYGFGSTSKKAPTVPAWSGPMQPTFNAE